MELPKPKTTREDPETRRLDLIRATARCLAEAGVAGTSAREVAARAGVSFGLIRFYFGSMDRLIQETYDHVGSIVLAAYDEAVEAAGADPAARLDAFLVANFRPPILDPALLATWTALWARVGTDPEIGRRHREVYAASRERLDQLLRAASGLSPEEARIAAIAITATIDGLWLELCLDPTAFSTDEAIAIVRRASSVFIASHGSTLTASPSVIQS